MAKSHGKEFYDGLEKKQWNYGEAYDGLSDLDEV